MTRGPLEIEPETFGLLAVGGGINGAGAARDAAGRGLRALPVEAESLLRRTQDESAGEDGLRTGRTTVPGTWRQHASRR